MGNGAPYAALFHKWYHFRKRASKKPPIVIRNIEQPKTENFKQIYFSAAFRSLEDDDKCASRLRIIVVAAALLRGSVVVGEYSSPFHRPKAGNAQFGSY